MSETANAESPGVWAEHNGVPEYKCHKVVRAAKIADIENVTVLKLEGVERGRCVSFAWLEKHNPQVGGYLVFYADGYVSYSPAKAFEEGYSPLCNQVVGDVEVSR